MPRTLFSGLSAELDLTAEVSQALRAMGVKFRETFSTDGVESSVCHSGSVKEKKRFLKKIKDTLQNSLICLIGSKRSKRRQRGP